MDLPVELVELAEFVILDVLPFGPLMVEAQGFIPIIVPVEWPLDLSASLVVAQQFLVVPPLSSSFFSNFPLSSLI